MKVVLTRPDRRGGTFEKRLRRAGHDVARVPLTVIRDAAPFPDPSRFDGVLFTSVSAVERVPANARWPRVGAVGPATAAALRDRGIAVVVEGNGGGAELAVAWGAARGERLLLPQAERAHPALQAGLERAGAKVTAVAVYRTEPAAEVDRAALETADVICFFAPSAVDAFRALGVKTGARVWGHGPTTRAAMAGLERHLDRLDDVL